MFTRDLRLRDNPMLSAAARDADRVVPLFVVDDRIRCGPGRSRFLAECLSDVDASLRELGGRLVVRRGELVAEVGRVAEQVNAARVHIASDVSGYAQTRETALRSALRGQRRELVCHPGVHTVVEPGSLAPQGKDHFAVFTPYHRRWLAAERRARVATPRRIQLPRLAFGTLPRAAGTPGGFPGGENEARRRATRWLANGVHDYERGHDALAEDGTSRLSPYLHFGCVSVVELAERAGDAEGFVRQLAWRDFHHQVLAVRPDAAHRDYRARGDRWRDDPDALEAWRTGHTGIPIVDAGMRQLLAEGWMHNRARMLTASFLTKTLYVDWRAGAAHFFEWLLDGDVANNCLNWQWVAGTGTDTRPNRVLNPLRQAERFDPNGDYVRRYVPALADLPARQLHRPWLLPGPERQRLAYPPPIVEPLGPSRLQGLSER